MNRVNRKFSFLSLVFFCITCATMSLAYGEGMLPGVCSPFYLLDEGGNIIDPVKGINADKPYSPKQTCGKCHDYDKITQGYHFQQGADEKPTQDQSARVQWALTPGNFGGTWCSPAPLYRYLSPKTNESAAMLDMTPQTFITAGCGNCHPGGGPVEFDRDGKRYDHWMADPNSGLISGGENQLDGDYYKTNWDKTGVLEADCLLCHLPDYDFKVRNKQLGFTNFRWAPTASIGMASVQGSVANGDEIQVVYDASRFNPDGTVSLHIVREPRNDTCLQCHAKPGWKKRGANFRSRTDVHLRAGLRCVDCHPAGSSASDDRIHGKEVHQFGKGDDPGGQVRNDLDDTCRSCEDCHASGYLGAPIAKHAWLPPLHLEEIACQTCHIPERAVKAAQFQAGDVFNPGPRIPTKGKHLWTFYGPDMKYWNHYGDLETKGYDDKPTDAYKPALTRYKGKIYPVNRVHSAWPGIETEGQDGLMQPRVSDMYKMWTTHQSDPQKYPALAKINDDNGDLVPEVNTPEEIDALIASVSEMVTGIQYPMEGKKVVWVMNNRVYSSGTVYREIPIHEWEASPYGNVHKYSHDIYPARAALGFTGCTDCHSPNADFFFASAFTDPFDQKGQPVVKPQYMMMGLGAMDVWPGVWRETYLKPLFYILIVFALLSFACFIAQRFLFDAKGMIAPILPWLFMGAGLGFLLLLTQRHLAVYMFPSRFWLDSQHFLISCFVILSGIVVFLITNKKENRTLNCWSYFLPKIFIPSILIVFVSGFFMLFKIPGLGWLTRYAYTLFDLGLIGALFGIILGLSIIAKKHAPDRANE
jgi:hypothetical protein